MMQATEAGERAAPALRLSYPGWSVLAALFLLLALLGRFSQEGLMSARQEFDRASLAQLLAPESYDNDLVLDSIVLPATGEYPGLTGLALLGLQRDRPAYRARRNGEVVAVAVPATADDGFNGVVELLVAVDSYGRIRAARVIEDLDSDDLYGVLDLIESRWMRQFTDNSMRDIQRLSWARIEAEQEYDQFVGASVTPKAVANRIYDTLVFFQSNRLLLMDLLN